MGIEFWTLFLRGEKMYIAIYVSAIVLLCAGAITFFIVKDKKNKKLAEKLKQQMSEESLKPLEKNGENAELATKDDLQTKNPELNGNQNGLENFSLEFENEKPKTQTGFDLNPFSLDDEFMGRTEKKMGIHFPQTNDEGANGPDEQTDEDDDLDRKFKEYEDFLRRNLDLDDEDLAEDDEDFAENNVAKNNTSKRNESDLDEEFDFDDEFQPVGPENFDENSSTLPRLEDDDLKALKNFDYDSLKDKDEEEIAEIIKKLPPKAQEILMSDILARRKFEDEE